MKDLPYGCRDCHMYYSAGCSLWEGGYPANCGFYDDLVDIRQLLNELQEHLQALQDLPRNQNLKIFAKQYIKENK